MTGTDLTDQAKQRLRDELDVLRARRREIVDGLDDLDTAGDRGDGAETLRRREDAAQLEDRIGELTRLLAGGSPPGAEFDDDQLPVGTRLTLRHPDGRTETLRAVAITEQVEPGEEDAVVTLESPLGRAVAGQPAGSTVRYETPGGVRELEILEITRPD